MVASLHGVGDSALWQAHAERHRPRYEEGLALARHGGHVVDVALFAFHLGQLWWLLGELDTAQKHAEQALDVRRAAGSTTWSAYSLYVLASLAHERGDVNTGRRAVSRGARVGMDEQRSAVRPHGLARSWPVLPSLKVTPRAPCAWRAPRVRWSRTRASWRSRRSGHARSSGWRLRMTHSTPATRATIWGEGRR